MTAAGQLGTSRRWRALEPDQEAMIRAAYRKGARARELADAYGVTVRTIYRTIHRAPERVVVLRCAGYRATFVVDDDGPKQRTGWVAA